MTSFEIYLLLMLDNIGRTAALVGALSFIASLITTLAVGLFYCDDNEVDWSPKKIFAAIGSALFLSLFLWISSAFIPSTKQMAVILVLPKIINNEQVPEIPEKVLNLGMEWLEELRPSRTDQENNDE